VPIERKTLDRIKIESGIDIPTSTLRPSSSRGRGKSNESADTTVTSEDSVRSVSGEETETPANGDDPFVVDKTDYNPPHCATIHLRDAATIEVGSTDSVTIPVYSFIYRSSKILALR
jgi:hypothetical protein